MEWLPDSVGTLASQIKGLEDWEFVISDAGSTDGSLEYLYNLEKQQDNVHIVVDEGTSIGKGRAIAAEHAKGNILVQIADLDGIHHTDGRIFDIVNFYEELVERNGGVQMNVRGAFIITTELLNEIGGWYDLEVAEERELSRRLIREEKIRFCPIEIIKYSAGREKKLPKSIKRSYKNAIAKFNSGARLQDLVYLWVCEKSGIKTTITAFSIFPLAWGGHLFDSNGYNTYDEFDIHLAKKPREIHPELCIEPPVYLEKYAEDVN